MIPQFPSFIRLGIHHKDQINKHVYQFEPYSDFNFVSMWSWNTSGAVKVSSLHDNLVLQFSDYVTNEYFYTFLGTHNPEDTIERLLKLATQKGFKAELRLIPESNLNGKSSCFEKRYILKEDISNHDYIYDVLDLITLKGGKYRNLRKIINKYSNKYAHTTMRRLDISDRQEQKKVVDLLDRWKRKNKNNDNNTERELHALKRIFTLARHTELIGLGFFDNNTLIGLQINEIINNTYYMAHYGKSDNSYKELFKYLVVEGARYMTSLGCSRANFQQDLGIPGLRKSKMAFKPSGYLKKYVIRAKQKTIV